MFDLQKDYDEYARYLSNPLWYLEFTPEMERLFRGHDPEDPQELEKFEKEKLDLRMLFVRLYQDGKIAFGRDGKDMDASRQPIDTIVIHHTAGAADASLDLINIQHLFRLYVPEHRNPKRDYHGKPIWSNHFDQTGRMVFCAYHHLIWADGTTQQALADEYIGWHAGNWEVNCASIAVTFVGDLSDSSPTPEAIATASKIIARYPGVKIIGHREVPGATTICPGNRFLGKDGWKHQLID